MPRRAILVLGLLIAVAVAAIAKGSSTPLVANFGPISGYGVIGDGQPYTNSPSGPIQVYLNSSQTLVVMTYNSGRGLHFSFDPNAAAWQLSGLPPAVVAEIDLNGINYYGTFVGMTVGTTAQLKTDLMFHYGGSTWDLAYPSLAVTRESATTWLITSEATDVPYSPFAFGANAALMVQRKRSNTNFGNVTMPVHFTVTLQ